MQNCTYPRPYYFEDHCVSFALLQGILVSKVPASGPLKYSGYFPLSVDKSHILSPFICSAAGYADQPRLPSFGLSVCIICCMYAYAFPPALCTRKGSHLLLITFRRKWKVHMHSGTSLYQKPYTLFLCFKAERGFPTVPFIWTSVCINAVVHPYLWSRILHPWTPLTSEAHKLFFEHFSLTYINMYTYTYGPV